MDCEKNITSNTCNSEDLIILRHVDIVDNSIIFYFNKSNFYAWFENVNKHIPEVYELKKNALGHFYFCFNQVSEIYPQSSLKLSISNDTNRLNYTIEVYFSCCYENDKIVTQVEEYKKYFILSYKNINPIAGFIECASSCLNKKTGVSIDKIDLENRPVKIGVIGTCFSRSVFRSDECFNPDYKEFFTVPLTFFHDSLISLMSEKTEDKDYLLANDLLRDEVFRYIKIEFQKNLKEVLLETGVDYLVFDNYSDATLEVIEMKKNSYLTYNKYFSESIYKRKFSDRQILKPGESKHLEKYREAVRNIFFLLKELNLDKNVILIGGRLSKYKTKYELWESKMEWIESTNKNWDIYDEIFLREIPNTKYIDIRSTDWISDENTTIVGGASPSHYQLGYYKEIYSKIKKTVFKD